MELRINTSRTQRRSNNSVGLFLPLVAMACRKNIRSALALFAKPKVSDLLLYGICASTKKHVASASRLAVKK